MLTLNSLRDEQLVQLLLNGAVGILPTDTIYGLVARAQDPGAVARLYSLKDRQHKPGTVIAAGVEQLVRLGLDELTLKSAAHLWPNPLSIVLPAPTALNYLDQDLGSLAVRIPDNSDLQALLAITGPLLTTSSNQPGRPSANYLAEARAYFGDQVDFYVEGGDLSGRPPSTVARLAADGRFEVLRPGAVKIDEEGKLQ